jgi:hypothetical protein
MSSEDFSDNLINPRFSHLFDLRLNVIPMLLGLLLCGIALGAITLNK